MSTQCQVPATHPLMIAWTEHQQTEEFANSKKWAAYPEHLQGSLWALFSAGFSAGCATPSEAAPAGQSQQQTPMRYDPATGWSSPNLTDAAEWRTANGKTAWLFNPWVGGRRSAEDVGSDPFGLLVVPPSDLIAAAQPTKEGGAI